MEQYTQQAVSMPVEQPDQPIVRLTSENSRRKLVLQAAGFAAESITPPHEEPRIRETRTIASKKILDSLPISPQVQPGEYVVGSDALVYIGTRHAGKPEHRRALRDNLKAMAHNGGYDIRSHTVVGQVPSQQQDVALSSFPFGTRVRLNREKAGVLATRKGVRAYEKAFNDFYEKKFKYDKVASGVCVLVLVSMGMVDELDGVKLDAQDAEHSLQALYGSTFTAIMNVAPQAMMYLRESMGLQDSEALWQRLESIPEAQALAEKAFTRFQEKSALR